MRVGISQQLAELGVVRGRVAAMEKDLKENPDALGSHGSEILFTLKALTTNLGVALESIAEIDNAPMIRMDQMMTGRHPRAIAHHNVHDAVTRVARLLRPLIQRKPPAVTP